MFTSMLRCEKRALWARVEYRATIDPLPSSDLARPVRQLLNWNGHSDSYVGRPTFGLVDAPHRHPRPPVGEAGVDIVRSFESDGAGKTSISHLWHLSTVRYLRRTFCDWRVFHQ